jgi:predicted solute-binding protein
MLYGGQRDRFDLTFSVPSECADSLAGGASDIGIVPAVELLRLDLDIIPGAGIACHGPVRSILLITKVKPDKIRTLAADSSSRTSVVLSRVVLAERYSAEPLVISHAPDLPAMLRAADAALIIGDPALRLDPRTLPHAVLDLGHEWTDMTGLPMVFAVWAGRKVLRPSEMADAFLDSCRFGLAHRDEIARVEAQRRDLPEALAREYLTRHIVNELGERDYEGMRLFLNHARKFATLVSSGSAAE